MQVERPRWRIALGALFTGLALVSTLLALRATPVGTPAHVDELAELQDEVAGKEVAFLSLDRFAPYRLSGAERVQSPGGYVPNPLRPRAKKQWGQSEAIDFDSLESDVLDRFGYAVTTGAAYGSSAPENWKPVARDREFRPLEAKREGAGARGARRGPRAGSRSSPAAADRRRRRATAGVWSTDPIVADNDPWHPTGALKAEETAKVELLLPPGRWQISASVQQRGAAELPRGCLARRLPAALDGFYSNGPGKGPFWPAGELVHGGRHRRLQSVRRRGTDLEPPRRAERRAWLGRPRGGSGSTARPRTPARSEQRPARVPLRQACGRYVDWYTEE